MFSFVNKAYRPSGSIITVAVPSPSSNGGAIIDTPIASNYSDFSHRFLISASTSISTNGTIYHLPSVMV